MLLAVFPAHGQIVSGSISGVVSDPTGASVPDAAVTLVHNATAMTRKTLTDASGNFQFPGLEGGEYTIRISKPGFRTTEQYGVILSTGERISVGKITLELGAVSETVSVNAQAANLEVVGADRGDLVTGRQVEDLLVKGRNVTDLVQLIPGVVLDSTQDDIGGGATFYVQGSRSTMNNVAIDGVPATDMGNGYQYKMVVSQSAVAEVRVLISNYQAEYGRMAGSNIQIVTKSGARAFHGEGAYFKRHEQFNAANFFDNRDGLPKGRYRYNTWTYNIGGPLYIPNRFNRHRDQLFFFWQQEYWPTKRSASGRVTVPTELERKGDFSQTLDLNNRNITVRDPYNNRVPYPDRIIPASRINSDGLALLKMFPLPNFLDRSITGGRYNYVFTSNNELPKLANTLKIDYNINSANTLTNSFSYFREDQTGAIGVTTAGGNWPQIRKTWWSHPTSLATRYTRVLKPTLLNEFSFSWLNQPAENSYDPEELRKNQRSVIGFQAGQINPKANPLDIVPNATFGGLTGAANLAMEGRFPLYNRYHLLNWSDNMTWTHGPHTIKAGIYIEWFYRHQKKAVNFNGSFDFGANNNNPLDAGWAYANALQGVFNSYTETTSEAWMKVNTGGKEAFIQDTWRPWKRLTLDYGVRVYWISPITEQDNRMSAFVPARYDPSQPMQLIKPAMVGGKRSGVHPVTGQVYPDAVIGAIAPGVGVMYNGMVVAGSDPSLPRGVVRSRGANFGPRFGFAWDMFGRGSTTLRGGFGMFYNRYFTEVFANNFIGQPPLILSPVIPYGEISRLLTSSTMEFPSNVFAADSSGKLATVSNFSLSIQRKLPGATVFDVGYAGSLGRHLTWRRDLNAVPLGTTFKPESLDPTQNNRPLATSFLRPTLGYNNILIIEPGASSNYHSLQVSAKRRFSRHMQFGAAWTWSKTMNYNDSDSDQVTPLVPVRIWNYGLASYDRTHVFSLNYLATLPRYRTRNRLGRAALDGWQISGITRFVSGAPAAVSLGSVTGTDYTGTPSLSPRVDVIGNPVLPKSERTFSRNFRTEVFRVPALGTYGNSARTVVRGPGINNWDAAIFKNFPLFGERMRIQFRWELYNAFNHTQFSAFDTSTRFDAQGNQINSRLSEFTAARTPRQMQLALRLTF